MHFYFPQVACVLFYSLKGLIYLHNINIIHCDLKAGNILINEKGDVKLADFGVSRQLDLEGGGKGKGEGGGEGEEQVFFFFLVLGVWCLALLYLVVSFSLFFPYLSPNHTRPQQKPEEQIGTPVFMAPEVLQGVPVSPLSDMWSLGITAIEMVHKHTHTQAQSKPSLVPYLPSLSPSSLSSLLGGGRTSSFET